MTNTILVRRAIIDDLSVIQNFSQNLIKFDNEFDTTMDFNWPKSADGESFFKSRITGQDGVVYLAFDDKIVVGCLIGGIVTPHSYRSIKVLAEVEEIFVANEYRSSHVGAKLMQNFELWCRQKNIERIKVEVSAGNIRGIKFYNKNGFEPYNMILEKKLK